MSSSASLKFEPDTIAVSKEDFDAFCREHQIVHSPNTVGGNVFYAGGPGGVEIWYGDRGGDDALPDRVYRLRFSTFYRGKAVPDVARLTLAAWRKWGGELNAAPEIIAQFTTHAEAASEHRAALEKIGGR